MLMVDPERYRVLRERYRAGDADVQQAVRQLSAQAEGCLAEPISVVTDKIFTAHSPSSDPHDYVSIGTYFWPNPDTPDGLPYVRRDGELSPDLARYDRPRWAHAARNVVILARAGYLTDNPIYHAAAAAIVRRWFVDPTTRMHPHLRYAQMVPGHSTGRCYGIIDLGLYLPVVLDHLALVRSADVSPWSAADHDALLGWCRALAQWLVDDPLAQEEARCVNNHGVFFDRFAAHLAGYVGNVAEQRRYVQNGADRVSTQIAVDGSMPLELERTCSFGYSLMNCRGLLEIAWMAAPLGIEVWNRTAAGSGTMSDAVAYLYRSACGAEVWPHPQAEPIDWRMLVPVLHLVERFTPGRFPLAGFAHRLPNGFDADLFVLFEPDHPFGSARAS